MIICHFIFTGTAFHVLSLLCYFHFTSYSGIMASSSQTASNVSSDFHTEPCADYSARLCNEINRLKAVTVRKIVGIAFSAGFSDLSEYKHDATTGEKSRRFRFDISVSIIINIQPLFSIIERLQL